MTYNETVFALGRSEDGTFAYDAVVIEDAPMADETEYQAYTGRNESLVAIGYCDTRTNRYHEITGIAACDFVRAVDDNDGEVIWCHDAVVDAYGMARTMWTEESYDEARLTHDLERGIVTIEIANMGNHTATFEIVGLDRSAWTELVATARKLVDEVDEAA